MKLDVKDPDVFNKWRAMYKELTDDEHREFMTACASAFPDQQHFQFPNYVELFRFYPTVEKPRVLEMGGWKGELAGKCLFNFKNIHAWHNIDFCSAIKDQQACKDERYTFECPDKFAWWQDMSRHVDFDIFLSSNAIEHLSDVHLLELLHRIRHIPLIMLEAPIGDEAQDFTGYWGTHILQIGWNKINDVMHNYGYHITHEGEFCYAYELPKR